MVHRPLGGHRRPGPGRAPRSSGACSCRPGCCRGGPRPAGCSTCTDSWAGWPCSSPASTSPRWSPTPRSPSAGPTCSSRSPRRGTRPRSPSVSSPAYLLVAVQLSSMLMKHLPRRLWKWIHLSSYGLFWLGIAHGAMAGTDAGNPLYIAVFGVLDPARAVPHHLPGASPVDARRSAARAARRRPSADAVASGPDADPGRRRRRGDGRLPARRPDGRRLRGRHRGRR